MVKWRPFLWLLSLVLLAAGFVGPAWRGDEQEPLVPAGQPLAPITAQNPVVVGNESVAVPLMPAPVAGAQPAAVVALSDDASVLVAAICDLQLLAAGTDLVLDSEQWSALAAAVVRAQAVRHTYEAQIARLQVVAPGRYRAEIPVYAEAGEALREQFNAELRTELGDAVANEVHTKLGTKLEGRFAGFGLSVQTLDITGDAAGSLGDVQIARTASHGSERDDRITTRREIHFPGLEDPTGDSWHFLLARVGVIRGES
jgi:hypothetical protein